MVAVTWLKFIWHLLLVAIVDGFNIVSVQYQFKQVTDETSVDDQCPCTIEDEDGAITLPCFDKISIQCFGYDLDEEQAKENMVQVGSILVPDQCAPAYDNCIFFLQDQIMVARAENTRTLLVRSRLISFEDSDTAQDTGVVTTAGVELSRYLSVGCFAQDQNTQLQEISRSRSNRTYDPAACVTFCTEQLEDFRKAYEEQGANIIAAVHKKHCGCSIDKMDMWERQVSDSYCDEKCYDYQNTLCGGGDDDSQNFWNLFIEYEFQSFGSNGAYDPWRYVWYTIVVVKASNLPASTMDAAAVHPENYYLHAVNEQGMPVFPNQMSLRYLIYGLQYDVDDGRLVGLCVNKNVGRMDPMQANVDEIFTYDLCQIEIDESNPNHVKMNLLTPTPLQDQATNQPITLKFSQSSLMFAFTGVSTIVGKYNAFAFTQVDGRSPETLKYDYFYIYSIENGQNIHMQQLNFRVLQMFSNEQYGDIFVLGPRGQIGSSAQKMIWLGRVTSTGWQVQYSGDPSQPEASITYFATEYIKELHFYPAGGCSGPKNQTFISYRKYFGEPESPRERNLTGFAVMQIGVQTDPSLVQSKVVKKICRKASCVQQGLSADAVHGSISTDVPYAAIFNAEPGFPLTLDAPSILFARLTLEGLSLIVAFDKPTLRGVRPVDLNGDRVFDDCVPMQPDANLISTSTAPFDPMRDCLALISSEKFDCALIFDEASVELIGTNAQGTTCEWADYQSDGITSETVTYETVWVNLDKFSMLDVGMEVSLKADTIFAVPTSEGEFSPGAVDIGATVLQPLEVLKSKQNPNYLNGRPAIVLTASPNFAIDTCGDIKLDVSDTRGTGGYANHTWEVLGYTSEKNEVGLTMNQTKKDLMDQILATTFTPTLFLPTEAIPAGYTYNMRVEVLSRWGLSSSLTFDIKKLEYKTQTIRIPRFEQPQKVYVYQSILLETEIQQSKCAEGEPAVSCEWSCQGTTAQCAPVLALLTDADLRSRRLNLPPFSLSPPGEWGGQNIYKFSAQCFGLNEIRLDSVTAELRVQRSQITARILPESVLKGVGQNVILNARLTCDYDDEVSFRCCNQGTQNPSLCQSVSFQGDFKWSCKRSFDQSACFTNLALDTLDDSNECVTSNQDEVSIGYGHSVKPVTFAADVPYCYIDPGLLVVNSNLMDVGTNVYLFSVTVTQGELNAQGERRKSLARATVEVTDDPVVGVTLKQIVPSFLSQYPLTSLYFKIVFTAEVETTGGGVDLTQSEKTFKWFIKKETSGDGSTQAVDITSTFDWEDQSIISWNPGEPKLVIRPPETDIENNHVLETDMSYLIELQVTVVEGEETFIGKSSVSFQTAPGKPTYAGAREEDGEILTGFAVTPDLVTDGDTFKATTFKFNAMDWKSEGGVESQITFQFGYITCPKDGEEGRDLALSEAQATSDLEVKGDQMDYCMLEDANGDMFGELRTTVAVCTQYLACAIVESIVIIDNPYISAPTLETNADGTVDPFAAAAFAASLDKVDPAVKAEAEAAAFQALTMIDVENMSEEEASATVMALSATTGAMSSNDTETDLANRQATLQVLSNVASANSNMFTGANGAENAAAAFSVMSSTIDIPSDSLDEECDEATGDGCCDLDTGEDCTEEELANSSRRRLLEQLMVETSGGSISEARSLAKDLEPLIGKTRGDLLGNLSGKSREERRQLAREGKLRFTHPNKADTQFHGQYLRSIFEPDSELFEQLEKVFDVASADGEKRELSGIASGSERISKKYNRRISKEEFKRRLKMMQLLTKTMFDQSYQNSKVDLGQLDLPLYGADTSNLRDAPLSYRSRPTNKSPDGKDLIPPYYLDGSGFVADTPVRLLGEHDHDREELVLANTHEDAKVRMRMNLRRLGHFPRQPYSIGNHEVPAPAKLYVHKRYPENGPSRKPWERDDDDSTQSISAASVCVFCGLYNLAFAKIENTVGSSGTNNDEMMLDADERERRRYNAYRGQYLPSNHYKESDVRYFFENYGNDKIYTLVHNSTTGFYQIVDVARRRIVAHTQLHVDEYDFNRRLAAAVKNEEKKYDSNKVVGASIFGSSISEMIWSSGSSKEGDGSTQEMELGLPTSHRRLDASESKRQLTMTANGPSIMTHPESLIWTGDVVITRITTPITKCPSSFCDIVGLECHRRSPKQRSYDIYGKSKEYLKCCNRANLDSLCNEPPCWFSTADHIALYDCGGPKSQRRSLSKDEDMIRFIDDKDSLDLSDLEESEDPATAKKQQANAMALYGRSKLSAKRQIGFGPFGKDQKQRLLSSYSLRETWFDRWQSAENHEIYAEGRHSASQNRYLATKHSSMRLEHNIHGKSNKHYTFWDRAIAYEMYHENPVRRFQASVNMDAYRRYHAGKRLARERKKRQLIRKKLQVKARKLQDDSDGDGTDSTTADTETDDDDDSETSGDGTSTDTESDTEDEDEDDLDVPEALLSDAERQNLQIIRLEEQERPLLAQSQKAVAKIKNQQLYALIDDAKKEIEHSSYEPEVAQEMRKQAFDLQLARREYEMAARRNISQILTRVAVIRDLIVKQLITTLVTNQPPISFETGSFWIYIGKTTNMSAVHDAFQFPPKFIVPSDSPDEPTPTNPVTGFSFEYLEYKRNIYSWAVSSPPSQSSMVSTLIVYKANTMDLPILNEPEPVRVFANKDVFNSGICMVWDRFAPDTAGGAWSTRGIINDGSGCLATKAGDMGVFIDGRVPDIYEMTEATTYPLSKKINRVKMSTLATLIMILLINWFLVFWGYKHDEMIRSQQRQGIIPHHAYHYDGDGITTPMNANDPIAYKYAENRNGLFLKTFWNCLKREHILISPIFYHETFTRPQRLLCTMVMLCGLMMVNALFYGIANTDDALVSDEQYVISGILSALIVFPIYCFLLFMFTGRPMPVKKRLIKKRHAAKELDMIRREREKLEAQSSLMPTTQLPIGGMGRMGPGGGGEAVSLLALPPPIPMGGGGMPGQLALPAPYGVKPPAPRYPPPPGVYGGPKALPPAPQDLLPPLPRQYGGGAPAYPALPNYAKPKSQQLGLSYGSTSQGPYGTPPALAGMKPITPRQQNKPPAPPKSLMAPPGSMKPGTPTGMGSFQPPSTPPSMMPGRQPMPGKSLPPPPPPGARDAPQATSSSAPAPPMPTGAGDLTRAMDFEAPPPQPGGFYGESQHNMMPPRSPSCSSTSSFEYSSDSEKETEAVPKPRSIFAGSHRMPPGPAPPPPPMGMVRPPPGGSRPPNLNLSGSSFNRAPPPMGFEPKTPTLPPPSTRGFMPATPKGMPPVIPFGIRPDNMVARGQPPPSFPPPFKMPPSVGPGMPPGPPGGGYELALLGQTAGPGMMPPMGPGGPLGGGARGAPLAPGVPLPPPPPREDDSAFVRRVRLIYMDRVMREHQKSDLLEMDPVEKPIPSWVFTLATVIPYVACCTLTLFCIIITLVYALKFDSVQESHWMYAFVSGFLMVILLLDVIRSAVITIVELRKFEIRKRSKAGDFVVRKVPKQNEKDSLPALLRPKAKNKAKATPPVPSKAPKFNNMGRPNFLPDSKEAQPKAIRSGLSPRDPGNRTPTGGKSIPYGMPSPTAASPAGSNTSKYGASRSNNAPPPPMEGEEWSYRSAGGASSRGGSRGPGMPPPPPPKGGPPPHGASRSNARMNNSQRM